MKKQLLILCACLFGAITGVKAYTTADLTAAGWTLVTTTETLSSGANSNVYVLVDAGASTYFVMRGANLADRPKYVSLSNPFATPGVVWTLESRGTNKYAMRNLSSHYYLNSSANGYDDFMDASWTNSGTFDFAYSDAKWDITNSSVVIGQWSPGQYMGPWDGGSSVTYEQNVACNKDKNNAPGFKIYSISRSDYAKKYLKQTPNLTAPVDVTFLIVNPNIYQGGAATDLPTGWDYFGEPNVDGDGKFTDGTGDSKLYAKKTAEGSFFYTDKQTLYFDYYQTISNLPGGKYKSKANTFAPHKKNGNALLYICTTNDYSIIMSGDNSWSSGKDETPIADVSSGSSFNVGIKANFEFEAWNTKSTSIARADDFELQIDPYLSTMATEFNNGVEMTAGLWYHFEVANTGNHILTATNLNDIIYATGENTALSAAGSNKFSALQTLSANTDYYIRSSSNNTLTITPCISAVAEELPDNGTMTAGEWYYFDVATEGHYDVVASSITNIVYTTDGNLAEGASVENKFSVKDNDLSAVRYYVKSSSAQTLKWFLTDDQDYSSSMSSATSNWSCVAGKSVGDYPKQNPTGVEVYNGNNNDFTAGNILYQTINDLPNGNYEVVLWAWENFAPWEKSGTHPTGDNIAQVFANDAAYGINVVESTSASGDNDGFNDGNKYTLNCHVTNGTLTYGVKNIATGGNWAVCRPISLTYTGPYSEVVESDETQTYEGAFTENTVVTPTAEYPIVNISGASFTGTLTAHFTSDQNGFIIATAEQKAALGDVKNVVVGNTCDDLVLTDGVKAVIPAALTHATEATYSRTIGASTNFGTICVPFALESNDDIQYYTVKSISDGVLTLVETSTVDAGVPAVYKKKGAYAGATNIVIASEDAAITKSAGTQGETVQLIGTFTGLTVGDKDGTEGTAANGNYYIGTDNRFYQGANYITVNPFRAYITGSGENAARLTIQIEDEYGTTSIVALEEFENENNLKDGKYLIDGKIVIVKNGVKYSANGQKLN